MPRFTTLRSEKHTVLPGHELVELESGTHKLLQKNEEVVITSDGVVVSEETAEFLRAHQDCGEYFAEIPDAAQQAAEQLAQAPEEEPEAEAEAEPEEAAETTSASENGQQAVPEPEMEAAEPEGDTIADEDTGVMEIPGPSSLQEVCLYLVENGAAQKDELTTEDGSFNFMKTKAKANEIGASFPDYGKI